MGQKFSTLKLALRKNVKVMDENKVTLISKEKYSDKNENAEKKSVNHQHFESIYNTSSEQLNIEMQEENEKKNSSKDETPKDLGIQANKDIVVEKSKYRSRKKRHDSEKKKNHWVLKFNCALLKNSSSSSTCSEPDIPGKNQEMDCVCTGYRKTENQATTSEDIPTGLPIFIPKQHFKQFDKKQTKRKNQAEEPENKNEEENASTGSQSTEPVIDLSRFNPEDYPIEDCDERARLERAREIAEGVDPPPGFSPKHKIELVYHSDVPIQDLAVLFQSAFSLSALSQIDVPKSVHSQIDYMHCLVPDFLQITSCSFYWGKMDRYEAERLLENKPEGTFLLRDSAQEEYLFSVSFRKYGRSLHARIEQWNHKFSFDSHDPGVFASPTVCGLIEHYKDPTCCMFFEPMLTIPLHRCFPFSLQHLCRAVICDGLKYDNINDLKLPKTLKNYLKEYHYKQRVRVRKLDSEP